jgi:hypothetical protein
MRIIAFITDATVVRAILARLGLATEPPSRKPGRAPPDDPGWLDEPTYGVDDPAPDDLS